MAFTVVPLGFAGSAKILRQTSVTSTGDLNIADGACTIYAIRVDSGTSTGVNILKAYNLDGVTNAINTSGTPTTPDMILPTQGSTGGSLSTSVALSGRTYVFKGGSTFFTSALSVFAFGALGTSTAAVGATTQYIVDIA